MMGMRPLERSHNQYLFSADTHSTGSADIDRRPAIGKKCRVDRWEDAEIEVDLREDAERIDESRPPPILHPCRRRLPRTELRALKFYDRWLTLTRNARAAKPQGE